MAAGHDGTVSKWYDQSGNDNHATQGTPASQPKIVSGGALVVGGLDFDGVDDYFQLNLGADLAQPNSIFMVHESDTLDFDKNEFFDAVGTSPRTLLDSAGTAYRMLAGVSGSGGLDIVANQKALVGAFYDSTSSFLSKDGRKCHQPLMWVLMELTISLTLEWRRYRDSDCLR